MQRRRALATGLVALAATAALAACGDDGPSVPKVQIDGGYVALGDSYTAAPGVPVTETRSGCFRSNKNYPTLISKALTTTSFDDVSCSGASTLSLVGAGTVGQQVVAPQFEALSDDTKLVTIGIGGNDLDFFATVTETCISAAQAADGATPCQTQMSSGGTDTLAAKIPDIATRVTSAVQGVHDRAPNAQVFLIGYPQPFPATGTCDDLPLAAGDYPYVRSIFEQLDTALEQAAADADATYIDLLAPSQGHDICAGKDAWIQGVAADVGEAIALHPFEAEQQEVADLVLDQLRKS